MLKRLFAQKDVSKEIVFLKFMHALAASDGMSEVEKNYMQRFMFKDGESKAKRIFLESEKQRGVNQIELLNELIELSKADNIISNEEATFIMIVSEALAFNVDQVMSKLQEHGLDINGHSAYLRNNFQSEQNNHDREVGFLAAKRRYESARSEVSSKYCSECGTEVIEAIYCSNCGEKIDAV
jgi:hypothetical protein